MSKVRIVNNSGQVKLVSKRVAAKTNLLKQKGWFIEEIEQPKTVEAVKAPIEAVPVDDVVVTPELNEPTLDELKKEYKEVLGKKPHHSWKEETLKQKIEDKKNE